MMRAMHRSGAYHAGMRLLALLACMLLAACASTPRADDAGTSFIVVRHAEKVDASRDPDLSARGHARAQALAARLGDAELVALYATEFKRTGQTIATVASTHQLLVTPYAADEAASTFAARLRAAHPSGTVLIAGHSNTVPGIVTALCECEAAEMPDHEYDRLSIVRITPGQPPALDVSRYGEASVHP